MRRLGKAESALNLQSSSKMANSSANTSVLSSTTTSVNAPTNNLPVNPLNAITPPASSPRFLTHRRSSNLLLFPSSSLSSSPGPSTPAFTRPASPITRKITNNSAKPGSRTSPDQNLSTNKKADTSTNTPTFELTPLSTLIAQSLKDMEMMKRVHGRSAGLLTLSIHNGEEKKKGKGKKNKKGKEREGEVTARARVNIIDFEKVEENLRGFEEFYRAKDKLATQTELLLLLLLLPQKSIS
ncbi:hypothetical protein BKA64DRAFT_749156 [Cadophora sp. MPI-SDFR-AT-0126]|nr:hypothetical protein BKA64DRAFT_749156 [Leotiomycetes sp. MPI-SDFR-AT-0126]